MNHPISSRSLGALLAGLALGSVANAQNPRVLFSVDYHGPTIALPDCSGGVPITEGELLSPCTPGGVPTLGPLATPRTSISGGAGGLNLALHSTCVGHAPGTPCFVEVDAFSYGRDYDLSGGATGVVVPGSVWFSVDRHARGIPGPIVPSVFSERPWGEAATDMFTDMGLLMGPLPPFAVPPLNVGVLDGNGLPSGSGAAYPGLGIFEPSLPTPPPTPGDNLDAFDIPENTGTAALTPYWSLDSALIDPLTGTPGSGSAAAHGFVGGDVLTRGPGGLTVVYAPAAVLGLDFFGPDTDDLDALILREQTNNTFQPSFIPNAWLNGQQDMLLFSVRRGSAVIGMPDSIFGLPIEPGDILTVPLPTFAGGVSPFPGIYIAAENLGLLTARNFAGLTFGDDLDALDTVQNALFDCDGDGIEDAVAIALGLVADLNNDGIPDSCQTVGTPYCFCPNGGICFNPDATAGCRNSTGAGALLTATGTTSVFADNLVLTTTSLPTGQLGLYLMGANPINITFGDGIRCVGGSLRRFPIQNSGAGGVMTLGPGIVNYTIANFAPAFWITSGQTWRFQNWYRDPGGPCGTNFNLSNPIAVTFTP